MKSFKQVKKYYGTQTEKAIKNFPFVGQQVHWEFITALVEIKRAAAAANFEAKNISREIKEAVVTACDGVLAGKFADQFPLPALQGGAGTSINMNVNEVLANVATEFLKSRGKNIQVHPNDHVNQSMSTNDANPSALKIAAWRLGQELLKAVDVLIAAFENRAEVFKGIPKLARTHLQDAVPTTLGEEFASYAAVVKKHRARIIAVLSYCLELNLGGTAIGSSINADKSYINSVYRELRRATGIKIFPAKNFMSQTSGQSDFLAVSQALTALCADCSKIASDLRLLSSGPKGGLAEIRLKELQKGSSIMPGKINPVLPEVVNQLYFIVSGNNLSIEQAVQASQLELGVMLPVVVSKLLESLKLSASVLSVFAKNCVIHIKANKANCFKNLEQSTAYATLLCKKIGYDAASACVEESVEKGETLRKIVLAKGLLTPREFDRLVSKA